MKNFIKENWCVLLAVALLLGALGEHPYGYYQLLRWVVALAAVYSAYLAHDRKDSFWTWIFVGVAVLFNPIAPFYLERGTWQILDAVTAGIFAVSIYNKK